MPLKGAQGGTGASPRSPTTFCDWEQFYLATIGASALHAAAWEGHAAILQYLLEAGQSPDARDDRGMTVLVVTLLRHSVQAMRAVFMGQAIVQLNTVVDVRNPRCRMQRASNRSADALAPCLVPRPVPRGGRAATGAHHGCVRPAGAPWRGRGRRH